MDKKLFVVCLGLLLLTAATLRFFKLDSNPSILNRDEAALAYNAVLLAQTGNDEWGRTWPLGLESFGDYKLLGYPFFLSILFEIFPLSDFLVRVPAALAGIGMVLLVGLLVHHLISKKKSTFLLAVYFAGTTPFLLFYSRIAFEAIVGLSFLASGVVLILATKNSGGIRHFFQLLLISITFSLAICTYNTPLLLLPALIIWIPFWCGIKRPKLWLPIVLSLLGVFVIFFFLLQPIMNRKSTITIFSDPLVMSEYPQYRAQYSGIGQKLLGNKYVYFAQIVTKNSFKSFSYEFLVERGGGHPWHQPPGASHLTLPLYWLALLGVIFLIRDILRSLFSKWKDVYLSWSETILGKNLTILYFLCVGLIPAVVTVDAPHATRSLFFLTILIISAVFAIEKLLYWFSLAVKNKLNASIVLIASTILILGISFGVYLNDYWTRYTREQPALLQAGLKPLIEQMPISFSNKKIAVVDKTGYAYILFAWYAKIEPVRFFNTIERLSQDTIGFSYGKQVGNFVFYTSKEEAATQSDLIVEWRDKEGQWKVTTLKN